MWPISVAIAAIITSQRHEVVKCGKVNDDVDGHLAMKDCVVDHFQSRVIKK
jgi:hypothetical protein